MDSRWQCRFINCHTCGTLEEAVVMGEDYACVGVGNHYPFSQFCYDPKSALKIKPYTRKILGYHSKGK